MVRLLRFILTLALLSLQVSLAWALDVAPAPLYLSFEQRVVMSYALLAQGESEEKKLEIVHRLNDFKNKNAKKGAQTVPVENFEQFLDLYRGDWPNTNSFELDMQTIEKGEARGQIKFVAKSPRVQRKINKFIQEANSQMLAIALKNQQQIKQLDHDLVKQALTLAGGPPDSKNEDKNLQMAKQALDASDLVLTEQMKDLDRIGTKISQMDMGGNSDLGSKIVLQTIFGEYFSRLSPESKKLIVGAYLGGDLNANDMQKFEVMIQNSGPQLQKLLQVIARQGDIDPAMLTIFKKLESSVKPVPWVQVEEILKKEKANYDFTYFERKALGIGTMAQVHRAKINVDGKRTDVVVRFIKPGIEKRVQEDHHILVKVAEILDANPDFKKTGMPQLGPMVDDITKTVSAELSQEDTISRQQLAQKAYDREFPLRTESYKGTLKFHVPAIYPAKKSASAFMVQEMVIGAKLDKGIQPYQDLMPDFKLKVIEGVARLWLQEVLFGSGFYHSDLHQGNFMVRIAEPATIVNILDFGMGGVLSPDLQARVLVLGAGVDSMNERLIAESLWAISDKNKNTLNEPQFTQAVGAKMKSLRKSGEILSMDLWTSWAIDQGIRLPYDFVNLNRGLVIVTKLLQDAGSKETMMTLTQSLAVKNPLRTWRALSQTGKMSMIEIIKLGWSQGATVPAPAVLPMPAKAVSASRCEAVFN